MKISNFGIKYNVVKLRTRKHTCVGCVAHGTTNLCNELRAVFFSRDGRLCSDRKVNFKRCVKQPYVMLSIDELRVSAEQQEAQTIRSFINYATCCVQQLENGDVLTKGQLHILKRYINKLNSNWSGGVAPPIELGRS